MFEIPGSDIVRVLVTAEAVRGDAAPLYQRGDEVCPPTPDTATPSSVEQEEDAQIEIQLK